MDFGFNVSDLFVRPEGLFSGFGHIVETVNGLITLAYKRGLYDGAVAGALITMLLMPSRCSHIVVLKGDSHGKDS